MLNQEKQPVMAPKRQSRVCDLAQSDQIMQLSSGREFMGKHVFRSWEASLWSGFNFKLWLSDQVKHK